MSLRVDDEVLRANLPRLIVFARIVEHGSLTRAAKVLGVSRPAVSQNLQALEDALGVRLVDRSTRKIRATQSGEELYASAQGILNIAYDALEAAGAASDAPTGRLKIASASGEVVRAIVIPAIQRLTDKWSLSVEICSTDDKLSLIEYGIDVAVRLGSPVEDGLIIRRFGQVRSVLLASPELAAQATSFNTLSQLPWAMHRAQAPRLELTRGDETRVLVRQPRYLVHATDDSLALIEAGLCIGLHPLLLARDRIREGRLVTIFDEWETYSMQVFAALPSRRNTPMRTRLFLESLAEVTKEAELT